MPHLRSPVAIATIASILVLNLALLVLGRSIHRQQEAWEWVVHTREVLEHVQHTLTLANEGEGAQRGYLLTGRDEYLTVYQQAKEAIPPEIRTLQTITADNPVQQESLLVLEALLGERFHRLQQVVERKIRGDPLEMPAVESGRLVKQQIVILVDKIRAEEQRLLVERQREVDDARTKLILAVAIVAVVSILLLILLWIISERDAARLRSERARLDATLRSIGEGVIATDTQGAIKLVNFAAERLAGIVEANVSGRRPEHVISIVDTITQQPVDLQVGDVLQGENVRRLHFNSTLLSKAGEAHQVEASIAPIRLVSGKTEGAVLVFNDVTERYVRERALAESEANYRHTIELNPQVPWKAAPNGSITGFSQRWLQLTGLSREAASDGGWAQAICADDLSQVTQAWNHALATGEPFDAEHRIRTADGSYRWMRSRANPRRDEEGRIIAWYGLTEDVHARKEFELALIGREAELKTRLAQIETIYSAVPVGLGFIDPQLRLIELNDALAEINGLPKQQLTGRRLPEIAPSPLRQQLATLHAEVLKGKQPTTGIEFGIESSSQAEGRRDWLANLYPVMEEDQVQGIVLAVLEVTRIKAAQRDLEEANQFLEERIVERTEQIAEANAELRAFAHTVAHDLRAPLRNIEGFATALIEDEADRLSDDGKMFANRIAAAVVRLDRLITDLLAYSRLSRVELRLEPVPMQDVMQTVQRDLETQIAESGAQIVVEDALPVVLANRAVLVQLTENLLSNAIKFVAPNIAPRIQVSGAIEGSMARLRFQDNGIGIDPKHQERVFGVFERLHGQEQYPGTGIGLAIVKKGAERMGGSITMTSQPGLGTMFELTLRTADNQG